MTARLKKARRAGLVGTIAIALVGTSACGVILYPERKGQVDGRIDPAVAILDGIGLLFFIVPGVIAFAVDFATGAIYLPGTADNTTFELNEAEVVKLRNGAFHTEAIETLIQQKTGETVSMTDPALRSRRPDSDAWLPLSAVVDSRQLAAITRMHPQASR